MAGIRLQAEESDLAPQQTRSLAVGTGDLVSDDDRSVAADSWSIKSDYGSTLDDDQRHADAAEALSSANFRTASDYNSDKDDQEPDGDGASMLGLQSYWDAAYADELTNFREHGHAGEICFNSKKKGLELHIRPCQLSIINEEFGSDVMDTVVTWTRSLCIKISQGQNSNHTDDSNPESVDQGDKYLSSWSVLDIGTGNGLLLQELSKQGFTDLTGVDYSEGAIDLARSLANRNGFSNINFLVDDVLETKLDRQFQLVMDKGTLDAIGLHPDGHIKRIMYWDSVSKLVPSSGILIITSCNNTKDELVQEAENFSRRSNMFQGSETRDRPVFEYMDHVQTYPTFMFGGAVGSRVATVAFVRG